jgi:hypothetical protein
MSSFAFFVMGAMAPILFDENNHFENGVNCDSWQAPRREEKQRSFYLTFAIEIHKLNH